MYESGAQEIMKCVEPAAAGGELVCYGGCIDGDLMAEQMRGGELVRGVAEDFRRSVCSEC